MLRGAPTQARPGALTLVGAAVALLLLAGPARADDDRIQEGFWNKRDVPKGWSVAETEHYQVQSQIGEETARLLGEHLEGMLELYGEFLPSRRKFETFVVKVFKDKKGYCEYSHLEADTTAVAFYRRDTKELVGYDCGFVLGKRTLPTALKVKGDSASKLTEAERKRLDEMLDAGTVAYTFDLARVLSHEGWHQYFHFYTVSWVDMPSWLDEGLGDYFFMAEKDPSAPHGYRLGDMNSHRLRKVRRSLEDGKTVSFERMMDFDQEDYYSDKGTFYSQGWSMAYFLMEHRDPARRELIPRLIKDFKDTKNFPKSTDKVFKGIKLEELDREWIGWLLSQTIDDPFLTAAREFGDKVGPGDLEGDQRFADVFDWYVKHPNYPGPPLAETAPPPQKPAVPPAKGD